MFRLILLSLVLGLHVGCTSNDNHSDKASQPSNTRLADGLGVFTLDEEDMWEGNIDVDGQTVKVFLHVYQTDFETLSAYAKRVLARSPLPDQRMLDDIKQGIKSMDRKFKAFGFEANEIDLSKFRVERLVFGKDFDGPEIELGINLRYPDDENQWHLAYYSEGKNGSLNWIPKSD